VYQSNHGRRRWVRLACGVAAIALVAAGCGDGADDDDAASGDGVEGDVFVTGSSTVEPISVRVAELYADVEPGVNVDVQGPGTGDGFAAFCAGEADITNASRAIEAEEATACEDGAVEFVELKVGYDGISVLVNPENPIECLSFADLYALVGPESQGFENWQDAQPLAAQLGSDTQFPDLPLEITAPGEESGTYDSFIELALGGIIEAQGTEEATRPDYSAQADDSVILQGVEGAEGGFGWVGFAFAEGAGDAVKEVPVTAEPGGECTEPSAETIADGSYPLSRPLFIYVSSTAADENPAVAGYVDFYVGDGYSAVEEVGYVALPDDELEATRTTWTDRTTGSQAG
jgi:phosphate transport system substrate-binding protein